VIKRRGGKTLTRKQILAGFGGKRAMLFGLGNGRRK